MSSDGLVPRPTYTPAGYHHWAQGLSGPAHATASRGPKRQIQRVAVFCVLCTVAPLLRLTPLHRSLPTSLQAWRAWALEAVSARGASKPHVRLTRECWRVPAEAKPRRGTDPAIPPVPQTDARDHSQGGQQDTWAIPVRSQTA